MMNGENAYLASVNFHPWEGENYRSSKPRLLVVGESHYDWKGRLEPEQKVTIEVVRHFMDKPSRFFTNIVATCAGELPSGETRRKFWHSVAFYNYVQQFAGDAPRMRPNYQMWQQSEDAFRLVLKHLAPDLILVLGKQNWDCMAELGGHPGESLQRGDGRYADIWFYPIEVGAFALAFHVKHPSAAYSFKRFHPLFEEARSRVLTSQL
jgi:hypothetical protein